ncbi:pro-FMRFamide-related neuropeptide FF isoform X1 [Psammomys obesus]|uniref:pro-FMRFamide-related neuropeptide FF isoform X1 n=1 Tax=Psammomys obesus TaxID=48139 RepID=UPI002452F982|nr:pro-FMRFamide-related neuropeptide FF isoform X1 [Psammomys obesus]
MTSQPMEAAPRSHSFPCVFTVQEDTAGFPPHHLSSQEEEKGPHPPQDAQTRRSLLRFLLQATGRPGRSPVFLFQPQRFGRSTWGSWSKEQLNPQAAEFWSLAAPQRFGKK